VGVVLVQETVVKVGEDPPDIDPGIGAVPEKLLQLPGCHWLLKDKVRGKE